MHIMPAAGSLTAGDLSCMEALRVVSQSGSLQHDGEEQAVGRAGCFFHDESNPLPIDALLVDEASMLDIMLGLAMLRALPSNRFCQLILVGACALLLRF